MLHQNTNLGVRSSNLFGRANHAAKSACYGKKPSALRRGRFCARRMPGNAWAGRRDAMADDTPSPLNNHYAFPACHAACSRRAASSKPALWPLIIVPIVLPRIVVLAAAPERIVETPATPAEVVTARDADIGRARAVDDAALRLVVQRNDELRAIIGLAVQRLVRNDER